MNVIIFLLLLVTLIGAVSAEEACVLPQRIDTWDYDAVAAIDARKDWRNADTETDYWLLSLSWSIGFCDGYSNRSVPEDQQHQCLDNEFGLVVHGLWAQSRNAGSDYSKHPRNCVDHGAIDAYTLSQFLCVMPGIKLIQKEWEKHGSCDFGCPETYLMKTKQLYSQLVIPPKTRLMELEYGSDQEIKDAFLAFNKDQGLKGESVEVIMKRDRLYEIHVCYDLKYEFTHCS